MKLWKRFFSLALTLVLLLVAPVQSARAAGSCTFNFSAGSDGTFQYPGEPIRIGASSITVDNEPVNSNSANQFSLAIVGASSSTRYILPAGSVSSGAFSPVDLSTNYTEVAVDSSQPINYVVRLYRNTNPGLEVVCQSAFFISTAYQCSIAVNPSVTSTGSVNMPVSLGGNLPTGRTFRAAFRISGQGGDTAIVPLSSQGDGTYKGGFQGTLNDGEYTLVVNDSNTIITDLTDLNSLQPADISNCVTNFSIKKADLPVDDTPEDTFENPPVVGPTAEFALCSQANKDDQDECRLCVGEDAARAEGGSGKKFWTAFGCVETSKEGLVKSIVRIGLGLSGGFVLLSILYGAFLLTTSSGDPKRVQEGQEMISSAIMGLFFVIFSVIILQFIGVSILQIPGFGT